ncbi:MAG: PEP-CTERM sorting domain-containing protein [Oleiphilaceae bacterium]|nr:PEP-CTERM sorting domain-containing protein [Oleiphilaceae bacterium]
MNYKMKTSALAAAIALLASGPAAAGLIDFEDAPSRGLSDNDSVTTEYSLTDNVTFVGGYLEASGDADGDPQGFLNDQNGIYDDQFSASPGLGDWFLRTEGEIGSRGGQDIFLSILFDEAVTFASGQIWDIDGNDAQGTEQWNVVALNGGNILNQQLSPLGDSNGPGSLDGLPWAFTVGDIGAFDQINFRFAGSKMEGVGLGFDNFRSAVSVPEPGTLGLLGLGLIGVVAARRRKA